MSRVWEFIWESLPPGFRFHPTDDEFVDHYLMNYIRGIREDVTVIPIVDDLFQTDPSELPRIFKGSSIIRSKDPEWWFLSRLKYKSPNRDKFDRSTRTGTWKSTGCPKKIRGRHSNRQIAMMRNLVFCENPRIEETNWVMHEYHLCDESSVLLTLDEQRAYVLCHLVNRNYDYLETSANMEVELELEGQCHGLSEERIQASIRSLTEELMLPEANDSSLHDPRHNAGSSFSVTFDGPVNYFDEMEQVMRTSGGDEEDDILDLLNHEVLFSTDEESMHSGEFEVLSFYAPVHELEETSREAVIKENRLGRPLKSLEGYVVIDETRGFVEDGDASNVPDSPKDAWPNPTASLHEHSACSFGRIEARSADVKGSNHRRTPIIKQQPISPPGRYHKIKEAKPNPPKAIVMQSVAIEPRSLTAGVRRNQRTRSQTLRSEQGNEKMTTASRDDDGYRPPVDYLVNLGVGIALLVLMMLWLLMH